MVDLLDPLDRWVTTGSAPADALTQTVQAALPPHVVLPSRPVPPSELPARCRRRQAACVELRLPALASL